MNFYIRTVRASIKIHLGESQRSGYGNTIRILHVDNDPEQLRQVKKTLEELEQSLKIESVTSPEEVPFVLLNGAFDAVLADYRMPDMNGIELEERVKRIGDIPFIMYRGRGNLEVAAEALPNVARDQVRKKIASDGFRVLADRLIEAVKRSREIRRHEVSLKVFIALTRGSDLQSTIGETLTIIREAIDIEAVGIRLKEGDDYPYFVFNGFHDKHILLENELCATDLEGQMMRDDVGNLVLECMCGNILRGRFDPSKSFFTVGGSFWTNSTTELLASTTVEDRLVRTRNTCQGEGYESVALIPIRDDGETIGLLQLNDVRPGCFNVETIRFLEGLGKIIGDSMRRNNDGQEALEELELYKETLRSAPIPSLLIDPDDMIILGASYSAAQMMGIPIEELCGTPCYEALKGYESVCEDYDEECPLMQMLERRGQASTTVNPRTGRDGEGLVEELVSPIRGPDGAIELAYIMVREDSGPSRAL